MALLRGCLHLVPFLVIAISCTASAYRGQCHRVFPLELTATAMPCRHICAFWEGQGTGYRIREEDDGTPCRVNGREGVCWYGVCLTRYGEQDEQFQPVNVPWKTPRHIRKRDVSAVKGSVSVTKTDASDGGSSFSTKTVQTTVKTVKTNNGGDSTPSSSAKGFSANYMTSFSTKGGTKGAATESNVDVNPFALRTVQSTTPASGGFFSGGGNTQHVSTGVKNGAVKIMVRRGPNGEKITTRTIKRVVIRHGPTRTVSRVIIRQGTRGGSTGVIGSGIKGGKTQVITINRAPMRGRNILTIVRPTGFNRKTTKTTTVKTVAMPRNPLSAIVQSVKQERIIGGNNLAGSSTATKTVSTVAVTKKVQPSLSVVQVTNNRVTPSTSGLLENENTAALKGLEVEVPGYAAGLRQNWKWVLARRVGMYPPYVQVLDPDVLFYKLGLRKPNIPSLPLPVQNILNRVPVHPVGSDLYGFLLSSRILEKIRGFTDSFNGLSRLKGTLSTMNASQLEDSTLFKNLLTSGQPSSSGSAILQKIILAGLSRSGNNLMSSPFGGILSSPYSNLFGGASAGLYGSPWASLPGGPFPENSWPLYSRQRTQFGRFGSSPSLYHGSSFRSYDSSGTTGNPSDVPYTLPEDDGIAPSAEAAPSRNIERLLRNSLYIKALLAPRGHEKPYRLPHDEYPEVSSEKLATVLARKKLIHLLNNPSTRSPLMSRIFQALSTEKSNLAPVELKRLVGQPKRQVYKKIIYELIRRANHGGVFGPSRFKPSYGRESDNTEDLLSTLRDITSKTEDESTQYVSTPSTERQVLEVLSSFQRKHRNRRYNPLHRLEEVIKRSQQDSSRRTPDTSDVTEVIEDLLSSSGREPTSDRAREIRKELAKALLSSSQGPVPGAGRSGTHLSKMISVHRTSRTESRPQGIAEAQVISTTYHANKGTPATPIPLSPVTSALEATRSISQQSLQPTLLGINQVSATSGPSPIQPYGQFIPQPMYSMEGTGISNQGAVLNREFVSSTGSMYGTPLGQPATAMMTGAGGYSGYATFPTNTAYMSQYATQPYYLGTSVYGGHPHYIVEGHEAPGTRWQLKVWRHHPGVSSITPGFSGFRSSHLGSVVTRARETVTRGLQLGTQPGHFAFATYGPSVPGSGLVATQSRGAVSGWGGGTSQYVVSAPDGSLVVSRQPLTYTSPSAGVVVSQTTKETTKTTSGSSFPTATGNLQSNLFQTGIGAANSKGTSTVTKYENVKQQYTAAGGEKPESLPEVTQNKESSLFGELASDSGSESTTSSTSGDLSSSSSVQAVSDLSQSKLRR